MNLHYSGGCIQMGNNTFNNDSDAFCYILNHFVDWDCKHKDDKEERENVDQTQ